MNIRKFGQMAIAVALAFSVTACGGNKDATKDTSKDTTKTESNESANAPEENKDEAKSNTNETGETKKLAVLLYDAQDTYIASVRQQLEELDKDDDSIELIIQDGQNNQGTQTDQINNVVAQGVDGILLNIVDVSAAPSVMETIRASEIPTVFFNRDMTSSLNEDDLNEFLFVGTDAPEAGVMQGEMVSKLWKDSDIDRNGNGVLDYVMLNGGLDNPEAQARTEYSVSTIKDNGIEVKEIAFQDAKWKTDLAKTAMDAWLQTDRDDIDVVLANNDGMAIGAISALQAVGMNMGDKKDKADNIVVVGVDATDLAVQEIDKGSMAGTVKQDAEGMAKAIIDSIKNKLAGKDWVENTDYKISDDGKSIRIDYQTYQK